MHHAEVAGLRRAEGEWRVLGPDQQVLGRHTHLITAVPLAEASRLLPSGTIASILPPNSREILKGDFEKARYGAAFAFRESLRLPFRFGIVPKDSGITVLLNDTSRSRPDAEPGEEEVWVVQTSTDFAAEKMAAGAADADVATELLEELRRVLGGAALPECLRRDALCWVYGDGDYELEEGCAWDAAQGLALAGDWCGNGRVEGAWVSGYRAAERVLQGRAAAAL